LARLRLGVCQVWRVGNNGGEPELVGDDLPKDCSIAVQAGILYRNTPQGIARREASAPHAKPDLAGSKHPPLSLQEVHGVTVQATNSRGALFWINKTTGGLAAEPPTALPASGVPAPSRVMAGFAVDDDYIYWANAMSFEIWKIRRP
jgi:hypothetical protein